MSEHTRGSSFCKNAFSAAAGGRRSIGESGGAGQVNIHNHRRRNWLSISERPHPFQFVQVAVKHPRQVGLIAHDLPEGVRIRHQALLAENRKLTPGSLALLSNPLLHGIQQFGKGRMALIRQKTEKFLNLTGSEGRIPVLQMFFRGVVVVAGHPAADGLARLTGAAHQPLQRGIRDGLGISGGREPLNEPFLQVPLSILVRMRAGRSSVQCPDLTPSAWKSRT